MATSRVIGLDIGTTHVRAAELAFDGRGPAARKAPEVLRLAEAPLPPEAVRDGEVAEPHTVGSAVAQLWREHRFSRTDVVVGVGNQRVLVRDLDLPAVPLPQLKASLPFQVADLLPVQVDDAILDYYPVTRRDGPQGPTVHGLLIAATKETVRANTAAVQRAGLRPVMVDLNAFALARVLARGDLAQGVVAFVDLGARVSTVTVVADGQPRFVRILAGGGQDVTDAVAGAMGIAYHEGERLKRDVGLGFAVPPELAPAKEVIADVAGSLVAAVRNTLAYYAANNPGAAAERVVVTGGGAALPGLGQYLSSATRLPVSLGQPLSTLRPGRQVASEVAARQPEFAVALGLAFGVPA